MPPVERIPHQSSPVIFDRKRWRLHRARGAATFKNHDFLHHRAMEDVVDRLETVTRPFPKALFYGAPDVAKFLTPACGVGDILHADSVANRLANHWGDNPTNALLFDEEYQPLAPHSLDLIVSLLTLHNVNDLIGALTQYRLALKPDGLFVAALFGGDTLAGFRHALMSAELDHSSGAAARHHPFADIKDVGNALSRAGFTLPVTDIDNVRVRYSDASKLISDLRGMGETNALAGPISPLSRVAYAQALSAMNNCDQIFDIIFCTAWSPHPEQQKPAKRGSATTSLKDALKDFD